MPEKSRFVKPRLEWLEGRDCPSSWIGYMQNPISVDWNLTTNWDDGHIPNGAADSAAFPSACGQTIPCPVTTLGSLTINRGSGMKLELPAGGLTVKTAFTQHDGWISSTDGGDLTINGTGLWDSGTISSSPGVGLIVNGGGSLTIGEFAGGVETSLNTDLYIGTDKALTTATAGTVTFAGAQTWAYSSFKMNVGNTNTNGTDRRAIVYFQGDPNNNQSPTTLGLTGTSSHGLMTDNGEVYFNVAATATTGLRTTTIGFPVSVTTNGAMSVQSRNGADLTADDQLNYALLGSGTVIVGLQNAADTADGNARVLCHTKGSNVVSGAYLKVYGLGNYWTDDTAGMELAIGGRLYLWSSGSTYEQTTLEIGSGDLRFSSGAKFYTQGKYTLYGSDPVFDYIKVDTGNVTLDGTCWVSPTIFGATPIDTSWLPVQFAAGGGTIGGVGSFSMDGGVAPNWSLHVSGDNKSLVLRYLPSP